MSAMGDIVHSLPAVAALRKAFPTAMIGWAVEDRWLDLLSSRSAFGDAQRSAAKPLVDTIHIVNTRSWRNAPLASATWRNIHYVVRELRAQKYDLAVDMQAAIRSALLGKFSHAPWRVGFAKPREAPAKLFYTEIVQTPALHVVEQGLQLAQAITGGECAAAEFPLPCDREASVWCEEQLQMLGVQEFAIVSPGAGWGAKCWPAERHGEVAKALKKEGFSVLVNAGPGEEALVERLVEASGGAAQRVSCSLAQLIALTWRARLFIGGDTGPVHLAAALSIPVVAIYGPTNPARNGPFGPGGTNSIIKVLRSPESRTSHARHRAPEEGLLQITTEQVIEAALALLRSAQ